MSDNSKQSSSSSADTAAIKIQAQVTQAHNTQASRIQLFNNSGATMTVPIINKLTGETDVVFVQHGGKPKLLPGFVVDSVYANRNSALQSTKVSN